MTEGISKDSEKELHEEFVRAGIARLKALAHDFREAGVNPENLIEFVHGVVELMRKGVSPLNIEDVVSPST